ncbi:MAG: hypothetical protein WA974_05125 [Thermodesulfobacteriota bacterium]
MTEKNKPILPCLIFVSKDGKWYHEGAEIIHRPIFLWLIQSLEKTEDGLFIVNLNNQKCVLEVEDTPLVVRQVDLVREKTKGKDQIRLTLNDESQEILDPETVWINKESVLYCQVKDGRFPARFLRPAYYQLAEYIVDEDNGEFALLLDNERYPIKAA